MEKRSCVIDQAEYVSNLLLETAIKNSLEKTKFKLNPKGFCYFCNAPTVSQATFCDEDCRDDYEYHKERKKING